MKTPKPAVPKTFQLDSNYLFAAVMSWLIPGAGHWIRGYRVRGLILAVVLLGTFWVGQTVLADNMAVSFDVHPIFFFLEVGNGFSTLLADSLWGAPLHLNQTDRIRTDLPDHLSLGILFCSISGLLNLLVLLHVMDPRSWTAEETDEENGKP